MRAVAYFRESAQRGASLAQQNRAFLDFCRREGHDAAGSFVDPASSNGHADGFRQLVAFLRQRGDDVIVVVPSVEALGGDLRDAARRYFQLEGLGARITPLSGTADPSADLVVAWAARDTDERLSDRVRAAMRRKAVKGEVLGRPPYGYKVGNRRRLELVPEEAVVVRYIFRLYLNEGMGIRLIARRLNAEALKTRRGGNWSMVSIRDILRNRAYLGTYSRFGVRVPGSHPPLVSADDFRHVQDRLNARRTSYAPRVPSQFLLSGLVHCGHCGNKLIGVSRKQSWTRRSGEKVSNSYRYYQCESRTNQSICSYHTRRAEDLEAEARRALCDALARRPEPHERDDASALARQQAELERHQARLRAIDRRLEGYIDSASKGRLAREKMRALSLGAAADRLAVEDAVEKIEQSLAQHAGDDRSSRRLDAERLAEDWDALPFAERQAALRNAVARLDVTDDALSLTLRS